MNQLGDRSEEVIPPKTLRILNYSYISQVLSIIKISIEHFSDPCYAKFAGKRVTRNGKVGAVSAVFLAAFQSDLA